MNERKASRLTLSLSLGLLGIQLVLIAGGAANSAPKLITAREFALVDDSGQTRIVLSCDKTSAGIYFRHVKADEAIASIGVDGDESYASFESADLKSRVYLSVDNKHGARYSVPDSNDDKPKVLRP